VLSVSSGEDDHERPPPRFAAHEVRHEPVAGEETRSREPPVAERIVGGDVRAREVDDEVGPEVVDDRRQGPPEHLQEESVLDVGPHRDGRGRDRVAVAPVLVVDGVRMDGGIAREEDAGPVAVVEVEVDHEDAARVAARARLVDGDGDVVEHAESLASVRERVVEAAAEVDPDAAAADGLPERLDRSARHQALELERPLGLARRHLDPEDPREDVGVLEALEVLVGVDAQEAPVRRGTRLREDSPPEELSDLERGEDLLAAKRVERHAGRAALVSGIVDNGELRGREAPPPPEPPQRARAKVLPRRARRSLRRHLAAAQNERRYWMLRMFTREEYVPTRLPVGGAVVASWFPRLLVASFTNRCA
jgi:hypothetical protein